MPTRTSTAVLFALTAVASAGESFKDEQLAKLAAETVKARAAARGFLLDTRRYAMPAQALRGWRVGIDKQPGHDEMERLVSAAIIRHNQATALLPTYPAPPVTSTLMPSQSAVAASIFSFWVVAETPILGSRS